MKALVKFFAGMPLPLLIGLTALAFMQLLVMIAFFIWPDQYVLLGYLSMLGTVLVLMGWLAVIFYELHTGKRVCRQ